MSQSKHQWNNLKHAWCQAHLILCEVLDYPNFFSTRPDLLDSLADFDALGRMGNTGSGRCFESLKIKSLFLLDLPLLTWVLACLGIQRKEKLLHGLNGSRKGFVKLRIC